MRSAHAFCCVLTAVSIGALSAQGEDANFTPPLTQVRFDRLVPITYPVIRPNFARLRPTTEPLIHPGVPQVPITEGLTDSFAKPLLITSERPEPFLITISTTYRPVAPPRLVRNLVQPNPPLPVITHPSSRPRPVKPAKSNTKRLDNQRR
jgi:hypothetical protein